MGNTLQFEEISKITTIISNKENSEETFDTFASLIQIIPKEHVNILSQLYEIFSLYNYSQIQNFSNNLIAYMKYQMKDKLNNLNQTAELTLSFILSIIKKIKTLREYLPFAYNEILDEGKNAKQIIERTFPYNIFIFCINTLNNDEFLYQKDIFQREMDKFDFISKLTGCLFTLVYYNEYPKNKNSSSSVKYADTIKVFILNSKELYIEQKIKGNFIRKLYNTCINNFDKLINKRWDPQISRESFERFLYMNFFLLVYFLCDINKFIFQSSNKEFVDNINQNTFNIKTLKVFEMVYLGVNKSEKDAKNTLEIKDEVNAFNTQIKEYINSSLLQTSNLFKEFIGKFLFNYNSVTIQFKILVNIFLAYCFEANSDICEMICLTGDYISTILNQNSLLTSFDLLIIYLLSKTKNFYITVKHLNINLYDYSNKFLDRVITNREEKDKKFTFSIYFMLLTMKNLTLNMKEIDKEFIDKMKTYHEVLADIELTQDNLFDNLICLSIYYEIFLGFITHLDYPAHVIYRVLKGKSDFVSLYVKYSSFYKNNFELEEKGKKIWNNYTLLYKDFIAFIEGIEKKISDEGIDINYSPSNIVIGIINKTVYKEKKFNNKFSNVSIFGEGIEKFAISAIHLFEEFKILTY